MGTKQASHKSAAKRQPSIAPSGQQPWQIHAKSALTPPPVARAGTGTGRCVDSVGRLRARAAARWFWAMSALSPASLACTSDPEPVPAPQPSVEVSPPSVPRLGADGVEPVSDPSDLSVPSITTKQVVGVGAELSDLLGDPEPRSAADAGHGTRPGSGSLDAGDLDAGSPPDPASELDAGAGADAASP